MTAYDKIVDGSIIGCTVEYDLGSKRSVVFVVGQVRKGTKTVLVGGKQVEIMSYSIGEKGSCGCVSVSKNNVKLVD